MIHSLCLHTRNLSLREVTRHSKLPDHWTSEPVFLTTLEILGTILGHWHHGQSVISAVSGLLWATIITASVPLDLQDPLLGASW